MAWFSSIFKVQTKKHKYATNKDIAKIQEVKTSFKDTWRQPEFLIKHLELLHFSKTSKLFKSVKQSGVPFLEPDKVDSGRPFYRYGKYRICFRRQDRSLNESQKGHLLQGVVQSKDGLAQPAFIVHKTLFVVLDQSARSCK